MRSRINVSTFNLLPWKFYSQRFTSRITKPIQRHIEKTVRYRKKFQITTKSLTLMNKLVLLFYKINFKNILSFKKFEMKHN